MFGFGDFLLSFGHPSYAYLLEYGELIFCITSVFLMYRAGKIGLSLAVLAGTNLGRLIFDHFWFFIAVSFDRDTNVLLWYSGFAASGFVMIVSCFFLHLKFSLVPSVYTLVFLGLSYISLLTQIITFIERDFLTSDWLMEPYTFIIPGASWAANIVLAIGLCDTMRKARQYDEPIPWNC